MTYKNFTLDVDGDGIALVTWDMAGRSMNVIDLTVIEELAAIVDKVTGDAAIKGAVVTSGKETFSGGADLTMLESLNQTFADMVRQQGEEAATGKLFEESRKLSLLYRRLETSGKPWVAAINGTALGGAFELCLACHHRVAADNPKTRVGLPEIKVGLFPGAGGTQRVARMMAPADALQMLLKGDQLRARSRQGDEAGRRGRTGRRPRQGREGLDQGGRQGQGAVGRRRLQAAGRTGLLQGRHDGVPARQRDLPARDLRQLSGRTRDPAMRL